MKKGIFLSDIHIPDNIKLEPIFRYMKDLKPEFVVLGGDILDAKGMHGIDSLPASQIKLEWYERDKKYLEDFLHSVKKVVPKNCKLIYIEGNHEERYRRIMRRYPDAWGDRFNFHRDVVKKIFPSAKWISYGDYSSFFKLGDTVFIHGTVWPDAHAKKYALDHTPFKCIYGHLHHFQSYTTRRAMSDMSPRYAVTAGCLSNTTPEWKKGAPNQWINGFISFTYDKGVVVPTVHLVEKGKFNVGPKEYK